jgi:hypothetical protein
MMRVPSNGSRVARPDRARAGESMDRDGFVALGGRDLVPLDPESGGFGFDDDDDAVTVQMRDPFAMTPAGVDRVEAPPEMIEPAAPPSGTLQGQAPHVGPDPRTPRRSRVALGAALALGLLGVCLLGGWLAG